jgi:hypothetical protein
MKFRIDKGHLMSYYKTLNGAYMDDNQELSAIFEELSLENQALLLRCVQLFRRAENTVKDAVYDQSDPISDSEYIASGMERLNVCEASFVKA